MMSPPLTTRTFLDLFLLFQIHLVKFPSNLTFPPSGAQGKISGTGGPPRYADDTFSQPVSGSSEPQQSGGWFKIFTAAAYQPYFDVDTSDVLERIKDSLLPSSGSFSEKTASNPDLYGPFWICTTLIFVAASIGTFATYLAHKLQHKEWNYDINLVTWSAGVFYGYVLIVPLCLNIIPKYFSASSTLVQLFCLYGYSLFIFIPAMLIAVPIYCSSGDIQMGDNRCGRDHVSVVCCTES